MLVYIEVKYTREREYSSLEKCLFKTVSLERVREGETEREIALRVLLCLSLHHFVPKSVFVSV